jgi:DNA mismatch repair protein MutS2
LHLLGRTVDEALPEIDRYLDRALREGWPSVRLIHGHGTGRLRRAVREHLRRHPVGRRFRPGGEGEGGDGATVVILGDDG